jgi:hypothetical protein
MLNQPMIEKLLAMRLHGMVEALKVQEQDRSIGEMSFLERLALLVDQQWSWRENQALARSLKAAKLKRVSLCGGHRLSRRPWPGQSRDARFGQRLRLGAQPREHFRNRAVRRRQELPRLGAGPESLS